MIAQNDRYEMGEFQVGIFDSPDHPFANYDSEMQEFLVILKNESLLKIDLF